MSLGQKHCKGTKEKTEIELFFVLDLIQEEDY